MSWTQSKRCYAPKNLITSLESLTFQFMTCFLWLSFPVTAPKRSSRLQVVNWKSNTFGVSSINHRYRAWFVGRSTWFIDVGQFRCVAFSKIRSVKKCLSLPMEFYKNIKTDFWHLFWNNLKRKKINKIMLIFIFIVQNICIMSMST